MSERNPEPPDGLTGDRHEHSDTRSRPLIVFMIAVLIALGVINIVIGGFGYLLSVRREAATRPPSELLTRTVQAPEPRLQSSPKADMDRMLAEETAILNNYDWVDRRVGVVRIPIERSMDLLSQRGFPPRRHDIPTTAGAAATTTGTMTRL